MRQRDSAPQTKRASAVTTAAGAVVGVEPSGRQGPKYRTKRPPPLPTRKAHKIKRIKAQRSSPWAALEPGVPSSPKRTLPLGTQGIVAVEEAVRKHEQQARALIQQPPPEVQQALANQDAGDKRWFLLLKVGRDELAGIWDGSLESCEPIVWRPATNSWAPLFEVPQIATLVSATVKQRQAEARSKVPASPAPRRPSRASIPPGRLSNNTRPHAAQTDARSSSRPSSLSELGGRQATTTARFGVRSPYIPPPPRMPQVHPAFDFEEDSETVPAFSVASRRPEESEERLISDRVPDRIVPERIVPLTSRPPPPPALFPAPAPTPLPGPAPVAAEPAAPAPAIPIDSYAPNARSLPPPQVINRVIEHRTPTVERVGWLLGGVAAALVVTTFTGLGVALRGGLVDLVEPAPGGVLAAALGVKPKLDLTAETQTRISASEPAPKETASKQADEREGDVLSVEELPLLGKDGKVQASDSDHEDQRSARRTSAPHRAAPARHTPTKVAASKPSKTDRPAKPPPRAVTKPPPAPKSAPVKFNAAAARGALNTSVSRAQFCAAERATGSVIVTFAPSGGVTGVSLASINGKDVRKGCVVRAFRGARVSPFQGDPVTVQKSFRLR